MAEANGTTNNGDDNENENENTKSVKVHDLAKLLTSDRTPERGNSTQLKHNMREMALIGSSIQFKLFAPCPATEVASKVFNIAELLEMILCKLKPGHILKSKGVCQGFRNSIQASKSMREKTSFFINIKPALEYGYSFNLGPQVPILDHTFPIAPTGPNLFYLTFFFTKSLPFTKLAQTAGFRELRLLNKSPQLVKVSFKTRDNLHQYIPVVPPTEGGAVTMGQVFDAITGALVSQLLTDSLDVKLIVS